MIMMRKLVLLAVSLAASMLLLTTCDRDPRQSPDAVLKTYLEAYHSGQYEAAYAQVASLDKSVKSRKEYLAENTHNANSLASLFADDISIRVLDLDVSQSEATAKVALTLPDIEGMLAKLGASASGAADKQRAARLLATEYREKKVPALSRKETYHLVREQGVWKVHLDWQTEMLLKQREERISTLLKEARQLRQSGSLQNALEIYKQVLALDSEIILAKQGIEDTKREIREYEEKQEYLRNVMLYDLKAKFYATYANNKVPGVEFKLKNNGDRLLREVEVTVYFKNPAGEIIAEERYYPVLAVKKSYKGDQIILKENYIWQMKEGNFYKAGAVPTEWEEGSVSAKVTNIEFAE